MTLTLFSYYRSSAAYRVRIALNLKGLAYDIVPVHLLRDGGQQSKPDYLAKNPQGRVPALDTGEAVLVQSPAILEWLEETFPEPPLLPPDPLTRARIRGVASIIACDIHPLQNLPVQNWLKREFGASTAQVENWLRHWMTEGFNAIEKLIAPGPFCFGATPSLADVHLVPQVFAARRFGVPMEAYPAIRRVVSACDELTAFQRAAPQVQPDAE